ncbi:unnamed protein product [Peniophora sp. CBMAI 1063]|nr:unnamed protein product [Peniophora sp. CBMAI 1063]
MSSDEEDFNMEVSGEESDFAPAAKKAPAKKAPAKKAVAKEPAAKKAPAKKAAAKGKGKEKEVEKENDGADSDIEDSDAPAPRPTESRKNKSASETYKMVSQIEHILIRPDSYIGSVEEHTQNLWTWDSENKRMVQRDVTFVPGFFKIVDEILVNAADHKIVDQNMNALKVTIDTEEGEISVYNNGKGIPVEIHSEQKIWIPEMIFGHLLSSSNYDDDEKKLTGGRNGYGAKLTNIYSKKFTVETANKESGKKYKQTWTGNMGTKGKASITDNKKDEEYTRVTFTPDLARFGMETIDDDIVSLLKKRVYDLAGTTKGVTVTLNGERLKTKGFKQYVDLFLNSQMAAAADASGGAAQVKPTVIYEASKDGRWEIAFCVSDGSFQHVSFANSISTSKGGTHVNAVADQLAKMLGEHINKKNKAASVKPAKIKDHMWLFVNALIENPTFDSQTKEQLTLPAAKFGSRPKLSEDFLKKVLKSNIVDNILNWAKFKADQQLKKNDGTKRTRLTGLPKLADANNAGTRSAKDCTLILTEGDSAKALAVAGLGVVGRDNFGVFPLRGKMLNVREAKHDQIMKNEEIQNIKKIMGLQHGKDYNAQSITSLRYGSLMIMTDQDHDGSHIKGLLINFLDHFYPSLLKIPGFLVEFVTPIVRVTKGNQRRDFFTIPEYEQWLEATPDAHRWTSKYYKGLGTSKDEDARDYFSHMEKHMIPFAPTEDGDKELIELAFSKKKADERKEWLKQFRPGTFLNHDTDQISYNDFINKELILFSMADNVRSIPSVVDGLKPGQRKVIWGCFKRNLKKEIKVAQLVGYISEHAAYHHGEQSLTMTIVNLAQDYVGANNINLLLPNGQYGTRDQGGKDHASARYIFTDVSPITRTIFHPADDPLLTYLKDDNDPIEPEWYMPVIPMVLVNGAEGIGTGWSTNVPNYNPVDIVANLRRLMAGEETLPMDPWWRGYKGAIRRTGDNKYDVAGIARRVDDTTVEITELPIHKWTQSYKAELEAMIGDKGESGIKDYKEHHDNQNVHFVVNASKAELDKAEEQGLLEYFKLTGKVNTTNMICFDFDGKIRRYASPNEIIEEFYPKRLAYYQKRKDFLANELQNQFEKLSNQARFVQMIVNKELTVSNKKKVDIVAELRKLSFRPFPKISKAKAAGELEEVVQAEDEEAATGASSDYDYLLGMAIWSLTREKIDRLLQQAADKEAELMALLELSPIQIWNTDLDEFLSRWSQLCIDWEEKGGKDANGKKVKRKQAKLRTRKSLSGPGKRKAGGSDDDDDFFMPTAKNAAKKPAAPRSRAKPAVAKPTASGSSVTLDGNTKKEEPDSDVETVPRPLKAPTRKPKPYVDSDDEDTKPAKKPPAKKAKIESDDEFDESPAVKKKAPPKKKAKVEDDSDIEMVSDVPPPAKKAPARKAATKKAAEPVEIDSDDFSSAPPVKKAPAKKKAKADSDASEDEFDEPPKKKAPARKAPAKAKVDDSDDSTAELIANAMAKGKGKALTKRKSPDGEEDSEPASGKPAKKAKQASVTDFFGAGAAPKPTATARKASGATKPPSKRPAAKKKLDSDDEDGIGGDSPAPAPRAAAPRRAAASKTAAYVDISDDDDD